MDDVISAASHVPSTSTNGEPVSTTARFDGRKRACSLLDCRETAAAATEAASTLRGLYSVGSEAGCWLYTPSIAAEQPAGEAFFPLLLEAQSQAAAVADAAVRRPAVLRREFSYTAVVLAVLAFVLVLAATCCCKCFLLCREWLCQFGWARKYQYF